MKKTKLLLFVINNYPTSIDAIKNVKKLLATLQPERYEFDIIDILKKPEIAEEHNILAVPTLLKLSPEPVKKLIGNFKNIERIVEEFNIKIK